MQPCGRILIARRRAGRRRRRPDARLVAGLHAARAGCAAVLGDAGRDAAVDGRASHERASRRRTTSSTESTISRRCAPSQGSAGSSTTSRTAAGRCEVQVRVGDYTFDSSRFVTQDRGAGVVPSLSELPASLDDNYDAIRRQIWLTTDAAYKRAVSVFAKKKATFQNRAEAADVLPDFSRETPVETLQPGRRAAPSGSAWVDRVKQLSAVFASSSELDGSEVWLGETHGTSYYLNSEGFKTVTPIGSVYLRVTAEAQADDGSTVRDLFTDRREPARGSAADGGPDVPRRRAGQTNGGAALGAGRRRVHRPGAGRRAGERRAAAADARAARARAARAGRRRPAVRAEPGPDDAVPRAHRVARPVRLVFRHRHAVAQGVRRPSRRRRVRRGRRRRAGERRDARRQGTSADAADEPDATEEPAAVERARPERQRAARRAAGAQHAGDPGLGAQDEVPRAAQGAGQGVRLHRARDRRSRRGGGRPGRADHPRCREGHAGWKGGAGSRPPVRRRAVHGVQRHSRGIRGAARCTTTGST